MSGRASFSPERVWMIGDDGEQALHLGHVSRRLLLAELRRLNVSDDLTLDQIEHAYVRLGDNDGEDWYYYEREASERNEPATWWML